MFNFFTNLGHHAQYQQNPLPSQDSPSEPVNPISSPGLPPGDGPVGIILAISILIGAIAKLVEVAIRKQR